MARKNQSAKMSSSFRITKLEYDGKFHLLFSPMVECNYIPVQIEISKEQWDTLRFNFALKEFVNTPSKRVDLSYVY
jgi:hypothetical protein